MGVRGLLSLIQDCPEACKQVSIEVIASDHRRSSGCTPVLVVDGSNFIPWLYAHREDSLECIYGGQWIQFKEILERFVLKLKSKDINLVFIFDGTICEEKLKEWARRRMSKYDDIDSVFNDITQNLQDEVIKYRHVSQSLKLLAKFVLKELEVDMYQTDKYVDADNYIANYANSNEAVFGILSNDSEFIILDTKPMLSTSQLCLDELKTIMYDRRYFAERYLNLSVEQLPLFACLMGNDYVPTDDLLQFHRRIVKGKKPFKKVLVKNLCKLIKQRSWTGNVTNARELFYISREVFLHDLNLIKIGLESYVIVNEARPMKLCVSVSPAFEQKAHERHLNCTNVCIYNLLCKKEYGSSEVLEDCSKPPSALVYRPIRQRCYGILFNCTSNQESPKSAIIEERCWYRKNGNHRNDLNVPERIQPLPLTSAGDVKIDDLWFDCSERKRFEIFLDILQIPLKIDVLLNLPEEQIALSCILNYLIKYDESDPLLKELDVAVFVAQALRKRCPNTIKELEDPPVDATAVNLSTLFVSGTEAVLMALETCGFPAPYEYAVPWKFFDGKLFHYLYYKAKRDPRVRVLCNGEDEIVEKFHHLLPVVTDGTKYHPEKLDWSTKLKDFKLQDNPKT